MASVRAFFKIVTFLLWCLVVVPFQMLVMAFDRGDKAYVLPHYWHKGVCKIFGLKVQIEGTPHTSSQTLFVANHLSYLDVPIIGGTLQKASFVAKSEVAGWPIFGFLSKLQQTAFMKRERTAIAREQNALSGLMSDGKSLIIFPEGTSTDGREVLPFKSSLFSLALAGDNTDLLIQPFTVRLEFVEDRVPETQELRDIYAWHNKMDMDLSIHLWKFSKSRGATATLIFHDPIKASDYKDRKTLAKTCHDAVSKGLDIKMAQAA